MEFKPHARSEDVTQTREGLEPQQEVVRETTMSYARSRLYLGISCVGMWVTLCALALSFRLPERILSPSIAWSLTDLGQLVSVLFLYAFLQGAFDLFGGFVLLDFIWGRRGGDP